MSAVPQVIHSNFAEPDFTNIATTKTQ